VLVWLTPPLLVLMWLMALPLVLLWLTPLSLVLLSLTPRSLMLQLPAGSYRNIMHGGWIVCVTCFVSRVLDHVFCVTCLEA
jgi:hypothetical protein